MVSYELVVALNMHQYLMMLSTITVEGLRHIHCSNAHIGQTNLKFVFAKLVCSYVGSLANVLRAEKLIHNNFNNKWYRCPLPPCRVTACQSPFTFCGIDMSTFS